MFCTGDIVAFESNDANKRKYHLCISIDGYYIFLNSPKPASYPGDFIVSCTDLPGVPPTPSGKSIISCTLVMKKSDAELVKCKAKKLGSVKPSLLADLAIFVRTSPVLTEEEREIFFDAAGDWA